MTLSRVMLAPTAQHRSASSDDGTDGMRVVESATRIKKSQQSFIRYNTFGFEAQEAPNSDGSNSSSLQRNLSRTLGTTTDAGPCDRVRTVPKENREIETGRTSLYDSLLRSESYILRLSPRSRRYNSDATTGLNEGLTFPAVADTILLRHRDADVVRVGHTGGRIMKKPGGGPKPINRLNNHSPSQGPEVSSPLENKRRPFDLHYGEYARPGDRGPKRQRIEPETTTTRGNIFQRNSVYIESSRNVDIITVSGQSIGSQQPRQNVPNDFSKVAEYRQAEKTVKIKERRKKPTQPQPNGTYQNGVPSTSYSDGQLNSVDLTDERLVPIEDEIEEVSPRPAKAPPRQGSYQSTTKIERGFGEASMYPATKENKVNSFAPSRRSFPAPMQSVASSRKSSVQDGDAPFLHDSVETLWQSDVSAEKEESNRNIMKQFAKPKSDSIVTDGDIRPTKLRGQSRAIVSAKGTTRSRADGSDHFTLILGISSGQDQFTAPSIQEPGILQFHPATKTFRVLDASRNDVSEEKPGIRIKPDKIKSVLRCPGCPKIVVQRPIDHNSNGGRQVLIEFADVMSTEYFEVLVRRHGGNFDTKDTTSEYLDKIFAKSAQENRKYTVKAKQELPADITLLEQNSDRKYRTQAEERHRPLITNPKQRCDPSEVELEVTKKKQRLRQALQAEKDTPREDEDSDDGTEHERAGVTELPAKPCQDLEEKPRREHRHATRASGRFANGESSGSHVVLSPSPERWTKLNPRYGDHWKGTLTYPPHGKKRAVVDLVDIERLDDGEYLNDNLITFYLRYLEENLATKRPDVAKRVFFFSTFFYEKLSQGKGHSSINYEAVRRWTAKTDIFSHDYLIVPICEKMHWYLAIICYPAKLLDFGAAERDELSGDPSETIQDLNRLGEPKSSGKSPGLVLSSPAPHAESLSPTVENQVEQLSIEDEKGPDDESWSGQDEAPKVSKMIFSKTGQRRAESQKRRIHDEETHHVEAQPQSPRQKKRKRKSVSTRRYNPGDPRIMTLDSMAGTHSPVCTNLRDYLVYEAKERGKGDISGTVPSLGMTVSGIPLQDNSSDCGVFLLEYMEHFMSDPDSFVRNALQKELTPEMFFRGYTARKKREKIRLIIFELERDQAKRDNEERKVKGKARAVTSISKAVAASSPLSSKTDSILIGAGVTKSNSTDSGDERPQAIEQKPFIERLLQKMTDKNVSKEVQEQSDESLDTGESPAVKYSTPIKPVTRFTHSMAYDGVDEMRDISEDELNHTNEQLGFEEEPQSRFTTKNSFAIPDSFEERSLTSAKKLPKQLLEDDDELNKIFEDAVSQPLKDKDSTPVDLSPSICPPTTPLVKSAASHTRIRSSPRNPGSNSTVTQNLRSREDRILDGTFPAKRKLQIE